jgi:purine catabolism regulator
VLLLQDVLDMEIMAQARVVGGAAGIARPVSGVAVIETPVEDFVRPGQFILTTAIGCDDDGPILLGFVEEIRRAGAAGLAIAVGRYVSRLGANVVAWADRHGFALIELPWELVFASVINGVLERIIGDELRVLKQANSIRRSLTNVLLESGSLTEIAAALAANLGHPVLVLDNQLQVVAASSPALVRGSPGVTLGELAAPVGAVDGHAPVHFTIRDSPSDRMVLLGGLPGHAGTAILAVPVAASGHLLGYLGIVDGETVGASPLERSTLEHAADMAAICFLRERAVAETELRMQGDLVWGLATGRLSDDAEADQIARRLGYRLRGPFRAMVFGPDSAEAESGPVEARSLPPPLESEAAGAVEQTRESIREIIRQTLRRSTRQVMATFREGLYVCFVEEPAGGEGRYASMVRQVRDEVARRFPKLGLSCGIGGVAHRAPSFSRSYGEAQQALDFGRVLGERDWFGLFPQLLTLRVLLDVARGDEAGMFIDRFLGPLSRDGNLERSEAFRTLVSLMESGWNMSEAARRLHVHRQTLLYRLDHIRSVVSWDVSKPSDRFGFQLAVYLHYLAKNRNPGNLG